MVAVLGWPGSTRPPGGWKWMWLGAASRNSRASSANRLGGTPCALVNARERLDRVVAGLEARLDHARSATEPPRRALEEQPSPKRGRRFTDPRAHEPAEVERAQHRARRERGPVETIVERLEDRIDDIAQPIGRHRLHAPEHAPHAAPRA